MEYRVLGVVEVSVGGRWLSLNGKQRSLLALLLLRANERVSVSGIVEALWGDRPPASPATRVRTLVSELRTKLRYAPPNTLVTRPAGYTLRVTDGQLDLDRFSSLVEQARRSSAALRLDRAISEYDAAMGLWRGAALGGVSGGLLEAEAAGLGELRLRTFEERCEVLMASGRHSDAILQLGSLAAECPLREQVHALLMTAYYRAGYRREALDVYQTLRENLVSELGLEPMQSLRTLQQRILTGSLDPQPPRNRAG
ncbi:AfsR/SARP family transcriptional regulator [Streptomyces sp. MAR4 CNX-425]|uniref:AfsR/SARP family transcriptional regulator n=1 Tax=Streptomyces sp. MAR4 CNX-425 TaxID=3406343 RepID=UPI003B500BCB